MAHFKKILQVFQWSWNEIFGKIWCLVGTFVKAHQTCHKQFRNHNASLRFCRDGNFSIFEEIQLSAVVYSRMCRQYEWAFKAHSHSLQPSADSAVDCINAEIEKFLSLRSNATVCRRRTRKMQ